jgi:hypothetical protein
MMQEGARTLCHSYSDMPTQTEALVPKSAVRVEIHPWLSLQQIFMYPLGT